MSETQPNWEMGSTLNKLDSAASEKIKLSLICSIADLLQRALISDSISLAFYEMQVTKAQNNKTFYDAKSDAIIWKLAKYLTSYFICQGLERNEWNGS